MIGLCAPIFTLVQPLSVWLVVTGAMHGISSLNEVGAARVGHRGLYQKPRDRFTRQEPATLASRGRHRLLKPELRLDNAQRSRSWTCFVCEHEVSGSH